MILTPTPLDFWFATVLAGLLGRFPFFDLTIQGAIQHNALGGFLFALALFVFWQQAARNGQSQVRLRILTILAGSTLAIVLTLCASAVISWPPPSRYPGLSALFPSYLETNLNTNCFPSQSTALYATVAAGIYSLHRLLGILLWMAVVTLVALPRMYVGGHYFTDVAAGIVLGLIGYTAARRFAEDRTISAVDALCEGRRALRITRETFMFAWILQVAVEFRDVVWVKQAFERLIN